MYPNTIIFNVVVYICYRCRYMALCENFERLLFMLSKLTTKFAILHLKYTVFLMCYFQYTNLNIDKI